VHAQLLRLLGAARWPARYLMKHPGVIDELADPSMLNERFDAPLFKHNLQTRYLALQSAQADDDESLLNLLRRAHHAELFLTLARDLEGRLSVEQVADDLSALADAIVEVAASWVWPRVKTLVQHAGVGQLVDHARVFHQVPRWPSRRAQQAQQLCMHRGTL
jgi:glutamate-ammonia-ligase adenylyltransferase